MKSAEVVIWSNEKGAQDADQRMSSSPWPDSQETDVTLQSEVD